MTHRITRTDEQIDRVLNKAAQGMDGGTAFPGQSYEEGIHQYHQWLTGQDDDEPLAEVELEDDDDEDDEDQDEEDEAGGEQSHSPAEALAGRHHERSPV